MNTLQTNSAADKSSLLSTTAHVNGSAAPASALAVVAAGAAAIVTAAEALPAKAPCARAAAKIPYAGKEPPPVEVAAGTVIDGIDCSGMTDDPKKIGVPVYLQTQNRKALSPEQLARVKTLQAEARSAEQAKKRERTEKAKQLGMSPFDMKKAGANLKIDKKSGKTKAVRKGKRHPAIKSVTSTDHKTTEIKTGKSASAPSGSGDDAGPRKGSKTELVGQMLLSKTGCTGAEILKATGWPTVSVPQQAKAAGLKLRKEKVKGEPTRYFGSKV